jgi:phage/plasmid-like protein (TIGR03299 family)
MAHEVESMFSVKETPWHGLGKVIHAAPTIAEGLKLAGLDWPVNVFTPFIEVPILVEDVLTGELIEAKKKISLEEYAKVFVRGEQPLGVVGPNTHPLQNEHAFDFFQPYIDNGLATLETAGSLREGKRVWVMAKINADNLTITKNDEVAKFIMLSNSHDGTTAIRVGFTPIRIVCANTLAMAHSSEASKLIRIRHSKDATKNLEAVREAMNVANQEFEATAEQYRFLASRSINLKDLQDYVKIVLKMEEKDGKLAKKTQNVLDDVCRIHELNTRMIEEANFQRMLADRQQQSTSTALAIIEENMEAGRGTENKASRGTWWTALNALTEYFNHQRGNRQETRLDNLWFGPGEKDNEKALKVAIELADKK